MGLEEKILERKTGYNISYFTKIIVFSLIILLLIESIALVILINRKPRVVVVSSEGIPLPNKVTDKELTNLINTKQFILFFLNQLYDYNKDNYVEKIKGAFPLMSKSLQEQYLNEIETGGYIEQVNKYEITSSLTVKRITDSDIKKLQDNKGYLVKVNATKLKVTDFIDRNIDVNIEIGYRPAKFTKDNIWGLEVFYIKEENL